MSDKQKLACIYENKATKPAEGDNRNRPRGFRLLTFQTETLTEIKNLPALRTNYKICKKKKSNERKN